MLSGAQSKHLYCSTSPVIEFTIATEMLRLRSATLSMTFVFSLIPNP